MEKYLAIESNPATRRMYKKLGIEPPALFLNGAGIYDFKTNKMLSFTGLSEEAEKAVVLSGDDYAKTAAAILEGIGGKANITGVDNCITRLRLEIKDQALVNEKQIKAAGAAGVIRPGKNSVQVIIGTKVQFVADEFKKLL